MPDKKEQLLDEIADNGAANDEIVEKDQPEHAERVKGLLYNPEDRNEALWANVWEDTNLERAGIDVEVFVGTPYSLLIEEPINERDADWSDFHDAMVTAAFMQSALVPIKQTLAMNEESARRVAQKARKLTVAQLRDAAKVGPGKARFEKAKEKRRDNTNDTA